jgi:hypothetical protein
MGPMGGPGVLFRADVQRELKLTDAQISQLREAFPPPQNQGGRGGFGGPGGGRPGMGGPGGPNEEEMRQQEAKLKGILNARQFARFEQLSLQLQGPRALARPDLAQKLNLSEAQVQKIRELGQPQGRPNFGGGGGRQGFDPAEFERLRKEQDGRILAVLSPEQRQQWTALLGPEFKFERPQRG